MIKYYIIEQEYQRSCGIKLVDGLEICHVVDIAKLLILHQDKHQCQGNCQDLLNSPLIRRLGRFRQQKALQIRYSRRVK